MLSTGRAFSCRCEAFKPEPSSAILAFAASGGDMTSDWFLVHAKTGRELLARVNLERQGYETFLPLERRTVRHARRMTQTLAPYFPGYLFVSLDRDRQMWRPINSTIGVLRLVVGPDGPSAAPPTLIDTLKAASDADGVLQLSRTWSPGEAVRIVSGPFADQLGVVESLSGADRVRVLLSIMNAEVPVVLPADRLQTVDRVSDKVL